MKLLRKSKRYYNSIDNLPIGIFQKILKTGDVRLLGKGKVSTLKIVWEAIFNEYIKAFGNSEDYKNYLNASLNAVEMYDKAYNEGKRHFLNLARIQEIKAEESMRKMQSEGMEFMVAVAGVAKSMGFRIDIKECTVREYYGYLKFLETKGEVENNND